MKINKKKIREPNMKVINMVVNGKIPFKRFLSVDEVNKLVENGKLEWGITNQDSSPMLIARISLDGFNKLKKQRTGTITLWHSGSFNLAGVNKRSEAKKCYEEVIEDLIKLTPRVFERRLK